MRSRATGGGRFVRALRAQYGVALVDEFQDTDPRQWQIFRTLFAQPAPEDEGAARALFLIGDPKQAIYRFRGGDVRDLPRSAARGQRTAPAASATSARDRGAAAIAALFGLGGAGAFRQPGIEFEPVAPGGDCLDARFQRDGEPARPWWCSSSSSRPTPHGEVVRSQCAADCVAAIHGAAGGQRNSGARRSACASPMARVQIRAVRPADISVLVGRNKDALRMQRALSEAGIPSVAAGRASLYDSAEARDLRAWLAALAAPADDGRLRALLATPLFGLDAPAIAAFDTDLARHRHWQDSLQHWLGHAGRRGAMAALAAVCAQRIGAPAGAGRRRASPEQLPAVGGGVAVGRGRRDRHRRTAGRARASHRGRRPEQRRRAAAAGIGRGAGADHDHCTSARASTSTWCSCPSRR